MKSDLMHSRVQMEPNILKRLVTEVPETVATDVQLTKQKKNSFGVVSLWNIRRNSRYAAHARNKKPRIVTGIGY
jgi:uncharacterized protein YeaC (DUF1315 family)